MNRTSDTWFRKPLLYPLSYGRTQLIYYHIPDFLRNCNLEFPLRKEETMKRIALLYFLISLLILATLTGCGKNPADPPDDSNPQIEKVEFSWKVDGSSPGTAKPNDQILPLAIVEYEDGSQETIPPESISISLNGEEGLATITKGHILVSSSALSGSQLSMTLSYKEYEEQIHILIKKDPADYIKDGVITDYTQVDSMMNKERALPSDYVPSDLVKLEVPTVLPNPEINQLRKVASDALTAFFEEAKKEGFTLKARSGYRSYATQDGLYRSNVAKNGQAYADKYSARPGHSEHQTGLAMDITSSSVNNQLSETFGETEEGLWVAQNAHRFGFIIRYPKGKEAITGYNYEPWHLRYVGPTLAGAIFQSTLTMEEYFDANGIQ